MDDDLLDLWVYWSLLYIGICVASPPLDNFVSIYDLSFVLLKLTLPTTKVSWPDRYIGIGFRAWPLVVHRNICFRTVTTFTRDAEPQRG